MFVLLLYNEAHTLLSSNITNQKNSVRGHSTAFEMDGLWDKASTHAVALAVLVLLILTACFTRILSGIVGQSKRLNAEGLRSVAMLPYWVPLVGNLFSFVAKFEDFLQQTRYSIITLPSRRSRSIDVSSATEHLMASSP